MAAYVIVDLQVLDAEKLKSYSQQAAETIAEFGGEFVVKGKKQALDGSALEVLSSQAIIRFADGRTARAWYQSPAYQALIPLREEGMQSRFRLVEG